MEHLESLGRLVHILTQTLCICLHTTNNCQEIKRMWLKFKVELFNIHAQCLDHTYHAHRPLLTSAMDEMM